MSLERLYGTGSTSCGLRDRLREVDGPGSREAVRRVVGLVWEPDASGLDTSVVSNAEVIAGSFPLLVVPLPRACEAMSLGPPKNLN